MANRNVHILLRHGRIVATYTNAEAARLAMRQGIQDYTPVYDPARTWQENQDAQTYERNGWRVESWPLLLHHEG